MTETKLAPCAYCKRDVMGYLASFNAKDICADCEEETLDEMETYCCGQEATLPNGIVLTSARFTGNPIAQCEFCAYRCAYWECHCELEHECKED
jgi:hypothetical protein